MNVNSHTLIVGSAHTSKKAHSPFALSVNGLTTRLILRLLGRHAPRMDCVHTLISDFLFHYLRNFKKIVLAAYQWLSENYEDGDRIFLFGAECTSPVLKLRLN